MHGHTILKFCTFICIMYNCIKQTHLISRLFKCLLSSLCDSNLLSSLSVQLCTVRYLITTDFSAHQAIPVSLYRVFHDLRTLLQEVIS